MKRLIKYSVILILLLFNIKSFTQTFNENTSPIITARFRTDQINIKPNTTLFNVLVISNKSEKNEKVNISFEVPVGWNLIGQDERSLTIPPGDSLLVPVRAAASKRVKGEIGYSVIASVEDRDGKTLDNAYCFVKIPRISDFRFEPVNRISYFDQKTGKASLQFRLKNDGNIDEVVYLNFQSSSNLEMQNETDNKLFEDILVPAKTDTLISYPVQLHQEQSTINRILYRVDLNRETENEKFSTTVWFKNLTNYYHYKIPEGEKPLVVQMTGMNLFSEYDPRFQGFFRGTLMFKDSREITYYYRQLQQYSGASFYKNSRMHFEYDSKPLDVTLGDNLGLPVRFSSGRGAVVSYSFSDHYEVTGAYNSNLYRDIKNYTGEFTYRKQGFELSGTYSESDNNYNGISSQIGEVYSQFSLTEGHRVSLSGGISQGNHNLSDTSYSKIGLGYRLNYYGEFKDKIRVSFKNYYGSRFYYGSYFGKHRRTGKISFPLFNNKLYGNLNYNGFTYKPLVLLSDSLFSNKTSSYDNFYFRLRKIYSSDLVVFGSPVVEFRKSNNLYNFQGTEPFRTTSGYLRFGVRSGRGINNSFTPTVKLGYTWVTDYQYTVHQRLGERHKKFFNARLNLNYHNPKWGFYLSYYYGPYSIGQQYSFFYSGTFNQTLRIMPYYESYIYKDIISFQSKVSYMNSLSNKSQRINLLNKLTAELKYGITLDLLNTVTYQVSTDIDTEEKYKYSNTYFEVRAKKEFGWSQPRISYHDLKLNLYKDLNGNLRKDPNEPGVNNILVTIKRLDPSQIDTMDLDYEYSGPLDNNKLLSGQRGNVTYENITEGVYKISFANMGKTRSKFSADEPEILVHVNKNRKIDIPYLEKNKIFGKIILNRSKLSNLGNVPVGKIKIKAKDSKGRVTSTLTNKQGEFTIFAPSVDKYVVSVNNIFQEHFNLRKNNYVVQLNGYKQFEVNFIFDEKRRKINFRPSFDTEDIEVQRVRRTNLSGTVKDGNTLQPVRATIEIVDNTTGSTVETTKSDRNNGRFSTSFMTGSNYSMIVTAPGYWFYSEKLNLDQMLTIQDVEKDILLENIIIGAKLELNNLQFAPGSAEIPNDAYPELDRLIEQLKKNQNVRIQVAGHSDALETLDNEKLSVERAKAVTKYMIENGFSNIEYVGYKDKKPVAPNDTKENRAKNRRVEVIVVDK